MGTTRILIATRRVTILSCNYDVFQALKCVGSESDLVKCNGLHGSDTSYAYLAIQGATMLIL